MKGCLHLAHVALLTLVCLSACVDSHPENASEPDSLVAARSGVLAVDLVLGAGDRGEEYTFGRVQDVLLLADGSFIVLDALPLIARRYDRTGAFVENIGREGDGPGEYRNASMLAAQDSDSGQVYIADAIRGTIYVYKRDGTSIDTWSLQRPLDYPMIVDTAGMLVVRIPDHVGTRGRWSIQPHIVDSLPNYIGIVRGAAALSENTPGLIRIDSMGAVHDSIRITIESRLDTYVAMPNGRIDLVIDYLPFNWWSWTADDRFVRGRTDEYEIEIFDHLPATDQSRPSVIARRSVPPVSISAEERALIQQLIARSAGGGGTSREWHGPQEAPYTKPFYHRVLIGSDGRLWVMRHTESELGASQDDRTAFHERESIFDVLDRDGGYIGSLSAPGGLDPRSIRGDTVLAISRGEFGVHLVQRLIAVWH